MGGFFLTLYFLAVIIDGLCGTCTQGVNWSLLQKTACFNRIEFGDIKQKEVEFRDKIETKRN